MTLHEACNAFLDHCRSAVNLSDHTHRAYQTDLADFQNLLGAEKRVTEVDKESMRQFIRHLRIERKLKETTIKRRVACLKVFFRWAKQEEMTTANPFDNLNERIRLPKRLPRALGSEELATLSSAVRIDHHRDNAAELSAKIAIKLLLSTGIRVGELVKIDVEDLDLANQSLKIHGKGNRQRLVYLFEPTLNTAMEHHLLTRRTQPLESTRLFVTQTGTPFTTQKVRKLLANLAQQAGIARRITPHMLRHTAATQLLEAGVDIRFVQKLLGHQSISTTEIYTHVTDQGLRGALKRAFGVGG